MTANNLELRDLAIPSPELAFKPLPVHCASRKGKIKSDKSFLSVTIRNLPQIYLFIYLLTLITFNYTCECPKY